MKQRALTEETALLWTEWVKSFLENPKASQKELCARFRVSVHAFKARIDEALSMTHLFECRPEEYFLKKLEHERKKKGWSRGGLPNDCRYKEPQRLARCRSSGIGDEQSFILD